MASSRSRSRRRRHNQPSLEAVRPLPTNSFSGLLPSQYHIYTDDEEFPTRNTQLAQDLIELVNHCSEVSLALEVICAYALSSGTGDEMGFAVMPPKQFNKAGEEIDVKPTDAVIVARELLERCFGLMDYWQIIWRMMAWGDAFLYLDLTPKTIERALLLPSWQCFVVPSIETYQIERYEQRISALKAEPIAPLQMVHFAYSKRHLYGRSLFRECLNDWASLKDADVDIREGTRSSVIQPNLHVMPPGTDDAYRQAYKRDHEERRKQGLIPDIYLANGADVRKPQGLPASYPLNGMINSFDLRRLRIAARSRVPLYLLGIETKYAREIAYQPALSFVLFVGTVRQLLSAGLRQMIDRELALQGIQGEYRFEFPKINVNPWQPAIDEDVEEPPQVSDLD